MIACIVCRDGPVFTLVGVLCAGSSQNGDTLDFDFYMASCCELWASAGHCALSLTAELTCKT